MSSAPEDQGADPETTGLVPDADPLVTLACRWIDAWNWREVDELVEIADPEIEIRPLRLRGLDQRYDGHEGVRLWMAAIAEGGHEHRIEPEHVTRIEGDRVLAEGKVKIAGRITSPFSAIYGFAGGRMTAMSHYFTPGSLLESIGVLEPGTTDS